jgi:hypothetical protein
MMNDVRALLRTSYSITMASRNEAYISPEVVMEYDLTTMAGSVLEVVNDGKGYLGLTAAQRTKVDAIVAEYAARAVQILSDDFEQQPRG